MKRLRRLFAFANTFALALWPCTAPRDLTAQSSGGMREIWSIEADSSQFAAPRSIVITASCNVWITDPRSGLWRVPCYGGRPQQIGKTGEGPGEYALPWVSSVVGRDSILLWDRRLLRASVFDPDGKFVRSATLRVPEVMIGRVMGMGRDSTGAPLAWTAKVPVTGEDNDERGYVVALRPDGTMRDTLVAFPGTHSITYGSDAGAGATLVGRFDGPLARRPFVQFRRDGSFVVGINDRTYLAAYDATGRETLRVRLPFDAASASTRGDREAYADSVKRGIEREMESLQYDDALRARFRAAVANALEKGITWPERRPYFDQLALDERQDAAWILLPGTGAGYTRTWLVCTLRELSACRSLSVPHKGAVIAVAIHAGAVYAIEQSADGIPRVAKYASQ